MPPYPLNRTDDIPAKSKSARKRQAELVGNSLQVRLIDFFILILLC